MYYSQLCEHENELMKKLLSTKMEASIQQRARLSGPSKSLKTGKIVTKHPSSVKNY